MTNANDPINAVLDANYREGVPTLENRYEGLTKREYFAGLAMQGLLVNYIDNSMYGNSTDYPMVEAAAVRCADQLITELNKEVQP